MFHSTHCEILGDLLPHNVTVQYANNGTPALSFLLRTFEDQPQLMANSVEQLPTPQVSLWEQNADSSELTHTSLSAPVKANGTDEKAAQSNSSNSSNNGNSGSNSNTPKPQLPKLIQYHRCVMLHLTIEQIRQYSQLLTTHKEYTIYVTGRLLPASSVLAQGSHNAALPTGINTPEVNHRHQGLYYKKNNNANYQQNQEQESVLVVENLSLIAPEVQAHSSQMQAAMQQCKNPCTTAAAAEAVTTEATESAETVESAEATTTEATTTKTATTISPNTAETAAVATANSATTATVSGPIPVFNPLRNAYPVASGTIEQQAMWLTPSAKSPELMPLPQLSYTNSINRFAPRAGRCPTIGSTSA